MDSKNLGLTPPPAWAEPRRRHVSRRPFRVASLLIGLLALGYLTHLHFFTREHAKQPTTVFDDPMNPWENITPSPDLAWQPCYAFVNPRFRCARLTVPMDYARRPLAVDGGGGDGDVPEVHVALLLLPAETEGAQGGKAKQPLLLNPGGPGGSGTLMGLLTAPSIQRILGPDQPVIGFDPRGVPFTSPMADCWARPAQCEGCEEDVIGGLMHRLEWERGNAGYGLVNDSDIALRYLAAGQRGVNRLCGAKGVKDASVLRWAGTTEVARDMVSIIDAWGRWADQEGVQVEEELKGKLVYWGFSYGTYLGATFARMFPDRVGRLLLDGVVDAEFYESPVWRESLLDADKVLGQFFFFCAQAGRHCDLYRQGDVAEDVQKRYEAVMELLKTNPVTFTHPEHFFPVIVQGSLIKTLVFSILYSPIQGFPVMATILNYIYEGQYELLGGLFQDTELLCTISGNPALMGMVTDAQRAIMCSDKTHPMNMTVPELSSAYEAMAATSQFADIWMNLMMKCNGWDVAPGHFVPTDPWPSSSKDGQASQIETANPILFLSNTYDPVTPLYAAVKMALKFKGAGLLEQKSQGHCTISAVSRCTGKIVREYVNTGKVPPPPTGVDADLKGEWTRCGADEIPWGPRGASVVGFETAEEKETREAWQHVQRVMGSMQRWGVGEGKGMDREAVMKLARKV